jgi:putative addiction module killer protein
MTDDADLTVLRYQTREGRMPYQEWVDGLGDKVGQAAILIRVRRLSLGVFGDWKSVGSGVFELRMDLGPGYRVYFGRSGRTVVVLLCGGDKSSQEWDIARAKKYWKDYQARS